MTVDTFPTRPVEWLRKGKRRDQLGEASSEAMTGLPIGTWGPAAPRDPSDLRRCRLLLEAVPEWRHRLDEMHDKGGGWSEILPLWEVALHDDGRRVPRLAGRERRLPEDLRVDEVALMPVPRHLAIVVCNCGKRWGREADRAQAGEELEATEHAILASSVPLMVRHWQLGHRFTLGENAPREFLDTIARAAARAAGDGGEAGVAPAPRGLLGPGSRDEGRAPSRSC